MGSQYSSASDILLYLLLYLSLRVFIMGNSQSYEMEEKISMKDLNDADLVKSGVFGSKTYKCGPGKLNWGEGFTDEVVDYKRGPGDTERKSYDLTRILPEEKQNNTI